MKKTCKRVLAVVLSLVMVFSVISVGAVAITFMGLANSVTIGSDGSTVVNANSVEEAIEYMEANPDVIQRFTNAVYKGQQFVANNSAEDIAPLLQPYFEDISQEDMITVVQRYKDIEAWDTNPILEPEALEKLMDVMALAGQLEERADYNDIVTTEFAEKAIQTVKFE